MFRQPQSDFGFYIAPGKDPEQHLIGSCTLVELPSYGENHDRLREAAFWVYLRQDTQMAEKHRRRTMIDLDTCFMRDFEEQEPQGDDYWANRMVWIYARIINYCFGDRNRSLDDHWTRLSVQVSQWRRLIPSSFQPLYQSGSNIDNACFPATWFLCEWHGEFHHLRCATLPKTVLRNDCDIDAQKS